MKFRFHNNAGKNGRCLKKSKSGYNYSASNFNNWIIYSICKIPELPINKHCTRYYYHCKAAPTSTYLPLQLCSLCLHCLVCGQTRKRTFHPSAQPSTWWVQREGWGAAPPGCSSAPCCSPHPWPRLLLDLRNRETRELRANTWYVAMSGSRWWNVQELVWGSRKHLVPVWLYWLYRSCVRS